MHLKAFGKEQASVGVVVDGPGLLERFGME